MAWRRTVVRVLPLLTAPLLTGLRAGALYRPVGGGKG